MFFDFESIEIRLEKTIPCWVLFKLSSALLHAQTKMSVFKKTDNLQNVILSAKTLN
eukprot:UN25167